MKAKYQATHYPSDLTDEQWSKIKKYFPIGNKSKYHKRSLVEAVLYIVKTGCQWRMLPHDYPTYSTVWSFFRRTKLNRIREKILMELVKETRIQEERNPEPSYALIDSQSVKTVYGSEQRGFDGGKKTKGRKRHIVTDTMGNLLAVNVHKANKHDTRAAFSFLKRL